MPSALACMPSALACIPAICARIPAISACITSMARPYAASWVAASSRAARLAASASLSCLFAAATRASASASAWATASARARAAATAGSTARVSCTAAVSDQSSPASRRRCAFFAAAWIAASLSPCAFSFRCSSSASLWYSSLNCASMLAIVARMACSSESGKRPPSGSSRFVAASSVTYSLTIFAAARALTDDSLACSRRSAHRRRHGSRVS
mmetsp:Transcript_10679/g.35014  ORF Transcript_10679/g.35014 Transcript_10679/m.35014 type:complete len:213 (+) Transcript_10679:185-823(+)